ncbi:MmpS family transport accessory protein [Nocardia huaxiensis]|uniref:MmpS family transport accessory protein n=1 Tax=Nocardia huaxiensis TaxID=2755382 RepID=UPI001E595003|nr:MmpS family transport accessory protein [Nocardia huaxiensis]UFS99585.1 MmpS family protein [Nocardia huaxiensis]
MRTVLAATLTALAAATLSFAASPASAATHQVVYEVWGDASTADILWFSGENEITDLVTKPIPFHTELTNDSTYPVYGVTAQTSGKGNISCRVTVDGVVRAEETARGQYAVVNYSAV